LSNNFVALHTYGSCWIEEMELHGKPHYQIAFGDVSAASTDLRELEVDLFNDREEQILRTMAVYPKSIKYRSDVTGFFIHLFHDVQLNFHPDTPFEDYIDYETKQPSFTSEECADYEQVMDNCLDWCEKNGRDIYKIALEANQFSEFLEVYKKITDKEEMKKFAQEFIDQNYETADIVALHTYGGCYFIEEYQEQGKPMFQCIIENTNPYADNLREMEVVLFDWMDKDTPAQFQHPYPEKIENRKDIVRFFAYLSIERSTVIRPDDSFLGYINGRTREKTFTPEECVKFDQLMQDCHSWCEKNNTDIYRLGMDVDDFLRGHRSFSDPKTIRCFRRELPDDEPLGNIIRLHSYEDDTWIREVDDNGKSKFQCRMIDGSNLAADSLRSLEVDIYDANADRYLQNRQARKR